MKISIGVNIKRLRQEKNITQERLAEHLGISAPAVSKWERGETLPDIVMLLPLACYFGTTTDELLGFDAARLEAEIRIAEYENLRTIGKKEEYKAAAAAAYRDYPGDYRVMRDYMYSCIDGKTNNPAEAVLHHGDAFIPLCERILDECHDDVIRRDASHILAIIYKTRGENEKAAGCFANFPSWYDGRGHRLENIWDRGSDEWWRQVHENMYTLLDFALDKVERVLWNGDSHNDTKHQLTEQIVAFLEGMIETTGYEPARKYIASIYSEGAIWLYNNGYHDEACGYFEKQLEHCAKLDEFAASGRPIGDARLGIRDFMAGHFRTDVAKRSAEWMANAPFLAELRENERFQAVIKGVDK